MGLGPPVAALYVAEASPTFVRGTYGSFTQIASALGLMASLCIGIPAKDVLGWWRVYFWVPTVPDVLLALLMEFCAESPHWLFKVFDGHGGVDAASYISKNILNFIVDDSHFPVGVKIAVRNAFVKADHALADSNSLDHSSGTIELTALVLGRYHPEKLVES